MADITMCWGGDCPSKDTCYRFTANADKYRQSYFDHIPHCRDFCVFYLHDTRKENEHFEKKKEMSHGANSKDTTSTDPAVLVREHSSIE